MKRASVGRCFKSRKSRLFLQKASCRHPGYFLFTAKSFSFIISCVTGSFSSLCQKNELCSFASFRRLRRRRLLISFVACQRGLLLPSRKSNKKARGTTDFGDLTALEIRELKELAGAFSRNDFLFGALKQPLIPRISKTSGARQNAQMPD
ncbi:hypothetical protein [Flavobacterium sp.]|uniref:hypothetical protein n=1 Tax=Flavobacterium sp. TaxID=239 RepID=UPI00122BBEB8|nr:hypothetical protein [Flavobacterium sp.]RZJ69398.1 MAG: hypothetical protein EOO49_17680 [Flavobacterium sp.]